MTKINNCQLYCSDNKICFSEEIYCQMRSPLKKFSFWILDTFRDFCPFSSIRSYILRLQGVKVGKNVFIGKGVVIDRVVPQLISIGDNSVITDHVILLTHDSSYCIHGKQPKVAPIKIEPDVFIGVNSIILPGITIGTKSIIGALSLVNKDIPPNMLALGVPITTKKIRD